MVKRGTRKANSLLRIGGILLLSAVGYCPELAAEDWSLETKLKAICIYNYTKFVDWPEEAFADKDAPIVIGILGNDPFGTSFDEALRGRLVNNRPLVIKRFTNAREAVGCHILYISNSEIPRLPDIIPILKGKSVLTVGESSTFLQSGGMIRIYLGDDSRVHFDINSDTAKESKLKISSQLLSLAKPQ